LQDTFESRFCDFAKEKDCIFTCISPFSLSEQKIMKMPSNIQMALIDLYYKRDLISFLQSLVLLT